MAETREIKTTLALDGEKQFKAAMDEMYRGLRVLGSEMKLNTAIFGDNASSIEGLTNKGEILRKEITKQKEIVAALSKAVEESAAAYGESDKRTDAYRIKLNNAEAALAGMEGKLQSNEQAIKDLADGTKEAEERSKKWQDTLKELDSQLGKGIDTTKKMLAGVVAVGAAAIAAGKGMWELAQKASDLEESQNVVTATFKESGDSLIAWTQTLAHSAGISETSATKFVGTMGAMLKSMTGSEDASREMSQALVQLAGDMASFYNLDVEEAFNKLRSGISGETEPLKQLGINMSQANLEAYALAQGIQTAYTKMSQAEQAAIRYQYIMSVTADAQGDFARTSDGLANQQRILSLEWENMTTTLGGMFIPTLQQLIPVLGDAVNKMTEWFKSQEGQAVISSLVEKVSSLASGLASNLSPAIDGAINLFTGISDTVGWVIENFDVLASVGAALAAMFAGLKTAQIAVNIAMASNPIGVVIVAITALVATITLLIKNWDNVKAAIERAWNAIGMAVSNGVENIKGAFQAVVDWFGGLVTGVKDIGTNIVRGIWSGISGAYEWIKNKISGWVDSVMGWFKDLFGIHSPSRVMRDQIGLNIGKGVAEGITDSTKYVNKAMDNLVPDTGVVLDVTRRFNNVSKGVDTRASYRAAGAANVSLSDSAVGQLVNGFKAALREQGESIILLNDREFGRAVRRAVPVL